MVCVVTKSWGLCLGMALGIRSRDSCESSHHCRDLAGIAVLTFGSFQPSLRRKTDTNLKLFNKHIASSYLQLVSSCCMSTSSILAALGGFFQAKDGVMQDGQLRTGTIAFNPLYYLYLKQPKFTRLLKKVMLPCLLQQHIRSFKLPHGYILMARRQPRW